MAKAGPLNKMVKQRKATPVNEKQNRKTLACRICGRMFSTWSARHRHYVDYHGLEDKGVANT